MYRDTANGKNIELIMWAFEKGYHMGSTDAKEGVHINFAEIQKFFLEELEKFETEKNHRDCIGL